MPRPSRCDDTAASLGDYRATFYAARLAMAVLNRDGLVLAANPAFGELVGADPAELVAATAADLTDLGADPRVWTAYREVLCGRSDRLRCTRRLKHPEGHSIWVEVTVEPLTPEPLSGEERMLLSVADISDRHDLLARLRHLQMHDPVTRLPNRALFFERLSTALETASFGLVRHRPDRAVLPRPGRFQGRQRHPRAPRRRPAAERGGAASDALRGERGGPRAGPRRAPRRTTGR